MFKILIVENDRALNRGVCSENDSHEVGAKKFIEAIKALNAKMNIPDKITGIKREDISEMAKNRAQSL